MYDFVQHRLSVEVFYVQFIKNLILIHGGFKSFLKARFFSVNKVA